MLTANMITGQFREALQRSFGQTLKVSLLMLKIYVPLSLLTVALKQLGIIDALAPLFAPVMGLMGLPGEAALTLLAGFSNSIYAGLATMSALDLTFRQVTILGVVLGLAHSLFVETGILAQLRIATVKIALFRIAMAVLTGALLNLVMPDNVSGVILQPYTAPGSFSWWSTLQHIAIMCVHIVAIIFFLTASYEVLALWKHSAAIKEKFKFIPKIAGISENAFGPWFVGFFIGITYGAAMLFQFVQDNRLSHKDACLITVFLCLAHAMIEDTLLFVVIGGNFWWIMLTRVFMAFLIVRILSINNLHKKLLWIGLPKQRFPR